VTVSTDVLVLGGGVVVVGGGVVVVGGNEVVVGGGVVVVLGHVEKSVLVAEVVVTGIGSVVVSVSVTVVPEQWISIHSCHLVCNDDKKDKWKATYPGLS
jgi:hypothetical protein